MRRLQQPGSARTQARSRFTDDLRRRCVMRAAKQRAELVMRNRMTGDTLSAAQIIAQELRAASTDSSSPSAWTEDDEAQLLASLGRDAYVELMVLDRLVMLHANRIIFLLGLPGIHVL